MMVADYVFSLKKREHGGAGVRGYRKVQDALAERKENRR